MNNQQELNRLVEKCDGIMESCGLELPTEITYSLNSRFSKAMGRCDYKGKKNGKPVYIIQIAQSYFEAYLDAGQESKIEDTILHEMCHALPKCFNHGYEWQRVTGIINRKFGYHLQRCYEMDEIITAVKTSKNPCKEVYCTRCGRHSVHKTSSVYVKNVEHYRCRCGGSLKVREISE